MYADYLNETIYQDAHWRIMKHLNRGAETHYFTLWRRRRFLFLVPYWSFVTWAIPSKLQALKNRMRREEDCKVGSGAVIAAYKSASY